MDGRRASPDRQAVEKHDRYLETQGAFDDRERITEQEYRYIECGAYVNMGTNGILIS